MLRAPASAAALSSGSTWRGASFMPGISGAIRMPVGMPSARATASSRSSAGRRVRLVARHAFSSEWGSTRGEARALRDLAASAPGRAGERLCSHRAGVGRVAQRLPDALHQPVAALDPLVGVGVVPMLRVALPRRRRRAPAQHLRRVDLDHDLPLLPGPSRGLVVAAPVVTHDPVGDEVACPGGDVAACASPRRAGSTASLSS